MKKFATIALVILLVFVFGIAPLLFLSGCSTIDPATVSDETVAMAWFRDNYPDEKCDEVIIDDSATSYNGDHLVHAVFLNDGVKIASSAINVDWYRAYAFK